MKKIFFILICLFMSNEVKSLEMTLKCINYHGDELILYINSKYNYIGEFGGFEQLKKSSKKENKMEITDTHLKVIIPGDSYLNDDLKSVTGKDYYELNRVDGTLEYTETRKDGVTEKETIGKCKKHEKLF